MTAPTVSLVTGSTGSAHVTSANAGNLNAGIFGTGSYILNVGGKLACTLGTNEVTVAAGSAVHNGRQIDVEVGGSVAFASGTAGKYRHDLVVLRYAKSGSVESASIVCIQGTEAASAAAAADPAYNTGSILDGAAASDMVLCRVVLAETTATLEQVAQVSVQNSAAVEVVSRTASTGTSNKGGTVRWLTTEYSDGTVEMSAYMGETPSVGTGAETTTFAYPVTLSTIYGCIANAVENSQHTNPVLVGVVPGLSSATVYTKLTWEGRVDCISLHIVGVKA